MAKERKPNNGSSQEVNIVPNNLVPVQPLAKPLNSAEVSSSSSNRPKYVQSLKTDGKKDSSSEIKENSKNIQKNNRTRNSNNNRNKFFVRHAPKKDLKKPEVTEIPTTKTAFEYTISAENVHYFSGPNNYLSALFQANITVDGNAYNSVEHYYQACKLFTLLGRDVAAMTKEATTPIAVKQLSKRLLTGKVSKEQIEKWKLSDSFSILHHALRNKFEQCVELQQQLLDTGDCILIQTYPGDNFFAANAGLKECQEWVKEHEGEVIRVPKIANEEDYPYIPLIANGKNILGFLLMEIRTTIRNGGILP